MSCTHPKDETCNACGICKTCNAYRASEVEAAKSEITNLGVALGRSNQREEQLRQVLAQGAHNPIERDERNLALARVAIMRRRIQTAIEQEILREDSAWRELLQTILDSDALTRTRSVEEVLAEAAKQ